MHSTLISLKLSFTVIIGLGKQKVSNVVGLAAYRLHWLFWKHSFRVASHLQRWCVCVCEREREGRREREEKGEGALGSSLLHFHAQTRTFFSLLVYMESCYVNHVSEHIRIPIQEIYLTVSVTNGVGYEQRKLSGLYPGLISEIFPSFFSADVTAILDFYQL